LRGITVWITSTAHGFQHVHRWNNTWITFQLCKPHIYRFYTDGTTFVFIKTLRGRCIRVLQLRKYYFVRNLKTARFRENFSLLRSSARKHRVASSAVIQIYNGVNFVCVNLCNVHSKKWICFVVRFNRMPAVFTSTGRYNGYRYAVHLLLIAVAYIVFPTHCRRSRKNS
jgi:hypothetical protein